MAAESSTPPPIPVPSSFAHLVTLKLNSENYLLWKVQISTYLRGQDRYSYVDGTQPPPPKILFTEADSTPKINPAYQSWQRTINSF